MKALQLISLKDEKFQIPAQTKEFLCTLKKPLGVVTIVGKYRTGKSLFMNKVLLRNPNAFKVCPTINSCTKGLWMWKETIAAESGEEAEVIVVDTEGFGGIEETAAYNNKILLLALLLSSFFIYNSVGSIDENSLNNINAIANLAREIQTKNVKDQRIEEEFPCFLWVVRDFTLNLVDRSGSPIQPKEYLEQALEIQKGTSDSIQNKNRIRRTIKHFFRDRDCFTVVRPVENQDKLQQLNTLPDYEFRPQFLEQAANLRYKILKKVRAKRIRNKALDGQLFAQLAQSYVDIINSGSLPNFDHSFKHLMRVTREKTISTALTQAYYLIKSHQSQYLKQGQITTIGEQIISNANAFLKKKITDPNDLLQSTNQVKHTINQYIHELSQKNKNRCQLRFKSAFDELTKQSLQGLLPLQHWLSLQEGIKSKLNDLISHTPIPPHYASYCLQQWRACQLLSYVSEYKQQLRCKEKHYAEQKQCLRAQLTHLHNSCNELVSKVTVLERSLAQAHIRAHQEQQLRQLHLNTVQSQQQQLVLRQQTIDVVAEENRQLHCRLAQAREQMQDAQQHRSTLQQECQHYLKLVQSANNKIHSLECIEIELRAVNESSIIQLKLLQEHYSRSQRSNEEMVRRDVVCREEIAGLKQDIAVMRVEREKEREMVEQLRNRLGVKSKEREELLKINGNLSKVVYSSEERVLVLEQKQKQMKEYKRGMKNACSVQCMHCSKFFVPSIFCNHLNVCSCAPACEGKTVVETKLRVKQALVREAEGKPYTEYVVEVRRRNRSWQLMRKYKDICDLAQGLKNALPGVHLSEHAYIANPQESSKRAISIEERKRILEKYLGDLGVHPLVAHTQLWTLFIQDEEEEVGQENVKEVNSGKVHSPEEFLKMWTERNVRSKLSSITKRNK